MIGPMPIQDLLAAWGRSRAINDPRAVGYPSQTAFARLARSGGSWAVKVPPLDEDTHAVVDRVVSELHARNRHRHNVIRYHYLLGLNDVKTAKRMRKSRIYVRDCRIAAEAWLEGRLHDLLGG